MLSLENTKKILKSQLMEKLTVENVCFFYEVFKGFETKILKYIARTFCVITNNNKYLHLSFESFIRVLSHSGLKISSELEVFYSGDKWINHDSTSRKKHAFDLIKTVRLPLLTPSVFNEISKGENSFSKHIQCFSAYVDQIKNTPVDPGRADFQNRYCPQDSFFMLIRRKISIKLNRSSYVIYEFKGNKRTKTVGSVKHKILDLLFRPMIINETIYITSLSSIFVYSTNQKKLKEVTELPVWKHEYLSCAFMSNIYFFGLFKNSCTVFNIKAKKWKRLKNTINDRTLAACAVFGGNIVVSGGSSKTNELRSVEFYDHCANEWKRMPDMLQGRHSHASVSFKNKLFMLGGHGYQSSEAFDSFGKVFVYIKPSTIRFDRMDRFVGAQAVTVRNKVLLFKKLNAAVLDVEREKWR